MAPNDPGHERGLVFARILDGNGGGRAADWNDIRDWTPEQGFLWVHLDYADEEGRRLLRDELPPLLVQALTAEVTRPRCLSDGDGLMVILRGMNPAVDSDPEDLVSLRVWCEPTRAVTLRHRQLAVPRELRARIDEGKGPTNAADLFVQLCEKTLAPVADIVSDLDDAVDEVEENLLTGESYEMRTAVGTLRRRAIQLRRYLAPQRDAMAYLLAERTPWLDDERRQQLRELADRVTRFVEDLDSARDRAAVAQEELAARLSESMNKTMYMLSIVAAIFLPLGLITGLLGINVGGMPGTDSPWAFWIVCVLLVVMTGVLWVGFKRRNII